MEYIVAAYTDIGMQKETNQDSICVRRAAIPGVGETVLIVICDGMGGFKQGEVASAATVNAFGTWFDSNFHSLPELCGTDFSQIRYQWADLVTTLHHDLLQYSIETGVQLGTTVAAFFAYDDRYLILNIGDSRIYERKKELHQLTQDQSLVAREVSAGRITEAESRHHPQRNILLQCLGAGSQVRPAFLEGKVKNDALYLLCSDGLIHEVAPEELENRIQFAYLNSKESMTAVLCNITELCKSRGEKDNITAVLLRTKESSYVQCKKSVIGRVKELFHCTSAVSKQASIMLLETAQIVHTSEQINTIKQKETR